MRLRGAFEAIESGKSTAGHHVLLLGALNYGKTATAIFARAPHRQVRGSVGHWIGASSKQTFNGFWYQLGFSVNRPIGSFVDGLMV